MPTPRGWKWSKLTDLARLESGHTPSRKHPEYWDGDIPWIGIRDARESHGRRIADTLQHTNESGIRNSSARILPNNTVCLSRTASVGYVVVMDRPMATSQDFVNWVCSDQLHPEFLKYLLLAEGTSFLRFASGATHQTIYFPEVKAFHICHPPLAEQKRIVAILDDAFEKIATAAAHAERNLQSAGELFRSVLRDTFETNDKDWVKEEFVELCEKVTVGHVGSMKQHYRTDGVPFLRSQNIRPFFVDTTNLVYIDPEFEKTLSKSRLLPGDVAIVRTGYPGTAAVVPNSLPTANCSDVVIVRPGPRIDAHYVVAFFNSPTGRDLVRGRLVGAAQKHFNVTAAKQVLFPYPPLSTQRAIVKKLDALSSATRRLESVYGRKLGALGELKQSLLRRAFAGEL